METQAGDRFTLCGRAGEPPGVAEQVADEPVHRVDVGPVLGRVLAGVLAPVDLLRDPVQGGVGADPDIVVASAKAYLAALNKLHSKTERVAAQG